MVTSTTNRRPACFCRKTVTLTFETMTFKTEPVRGGTVENIRASVGWNPFSGSGAIEFMVHTNHDRVHKIPTWPSALNPWHWETNQFVFHLRKYLGKVWSYPFSGSSYYHARTASLLYASDGWLRSTVGRSLAGELTLSCARPAAEGWPLCW